MRKFIAIVIKFNRYLEPNSRSTITMIDCRSMATYIIALLSPGFLFIYCAATVSRTGAEFYFNNLRTF